MPSYRNSVLGGLSGMYGCAFLYMCALHDVYMYVSECVCMAAHVMHMPVKMVTCWLCQVFYALGIDMYSVYTDVENT